ncbi:hypothetical protein HER10_EVM0006958 [Colletotrichum scovillei]|uniref:DUF6594 domain-containing protein n=1 Tax=Colletotrichum scovillei TaxID=1209932 RepID=A0A9P7R0C4_9PEZI|nr:uncharacterized protein HER10_EVM0006958 [Colletotrichum scovillei]KAF4781082.1 hypothetical protein HER10_EVM0006958 [Colletotrichum scovillei]KAG7045241.1 hypothetical protein JMJ77_0009326 [Colletotrichum scovillei]KAG7052440.1 hypothetical protein JMJ78_0005457 [Colletotrichum scovillei]KAG7064697.1 hypothetical protein JMJ76_0012457 [Colletotrichum scovillei]
MAAAPPISLSHAAFADFLASDPELSVFRSFQALSARNLLHLQSKMLDIEAELQKSDDDDATNVDDASRLATKCWEVFALRAQEKDSKEAKKMALVNRLQQTIKEYHEALLLRSQVMKFTTPNDRVFRVFQGWFDSEQPFLGHSHNLPNKRDDFIALAPSSGADFLTRNLEDLAGRYLAGKRHKETTEVKYYSAHLVTRLVTIITVLAASLVIQAAIVTLYLVRNEVLRLCMIAVFTSVFAASLAVMTDGRRTDIILATAACAAVLVAFVAQD